MQKSEIINLLSNNLFCYLCSVSLFSPVNSYLIYLWISAPGTPAYKDVQQTFVEWIANMIKVLLFYYFLRRHIPLI